MSSKVILRKISSPLKCFVIIKEQLAMSSLPLVVKHLCEYLQQYHNHYILLHLR